jgi:hypothetical protein
MVTWYERLATGQWRVPGTTGSTPKLRDREWGVGTVEIWDPYPKFFFVLKILKTCFSNENSFPPT